LAVDITSRGRTFVPELLQAAGIEHKLIARGQPSGTVAKAAALMARTLSLARFAAGKRFDVAVGHGSRSLPPAARMVRVPNLTMFDYEHISTWLFRRFCDRILVPRVISDKRNGTLPRGPWQPFDGFKEEIYLAEFRPDPTMRARLGIREDEILAVLRPPSRTAHYHEQRSVGVLEAVIQRLAGKSGVRAVWLRRDQNDAPPVWGADNIVVPDSSLDGPSLLATADLVVSGGGTMNREAALLGTPAYSIFTGAQGVLDAVLVRQGRLVQIGAPDEVERIDLKRKSVSGRPPLNTRLRDFVVEQIEEVARRG